MSKSECSMEYMASELIRAIKFKPKNLIATDTESGVKKVFYKPRAKTSLYTVYFKALNGNMHDNPFVEEFMLKEVERSLSLVTDYFINVKKSRSEELENRAFKLLQSLNDKFQELERICYSLVKYCSNFKISEWPELRQYLIVNSRIDPSKFNEYAAKNNLDDYLSAKVSMYVLLIELDKAVPERLDESFGLVIDWIQTAAANLVSVHERIGLTRELSNPRIVELLVEHATDKHVEKLVNLYLCFLNISLQSANNNLEDGYEHTNMLVNRYLSSLWNIFKKTNVVYWKNFTDRLIESAVEHPFFVFKVCAEIRFRLPEPLEEQIFVSITERVNSKFKTILGEIAGEWGWRARYKILNFCTSEHIESVHDYILNSIRNRTKATDNFFMTIGSQLMFDKYVDNLKLLVRQGVKLNSI